MTSGSRTDTITSDVAPVEIAQQRKAEPVLLAEARMGLHRVLGDAHHRGPGLGERLDGGGEGLRLARAAGGGAPV